jgi:hypothetical protein
LTDFSVRLWVLNELATRSFPRGRIVVSYDRQRRAAASQTEVRRGIGARRAPGDHGGCARPRARLRPRLA